MEILFYNDKELSTLREEVLLYQKSNKESNVRTNGRAGE